MENDLLYMSKEQVETFVEIDKRMKPEDLACIKYNFNRYWTAENVLTEDLLILIRCIKCLMILTMKSIN